MTYRIRVLVLIVTMVAVIIPFGHSTAAADPLDLTCAGTQTTTYSPGLTLVPNEQTVGVTNIFAPCASTSVPAVTSGTSSVTAHAVLSCLDLPVADTVSTTIFWNTGHTSVFTFNRTVTHVGGNTIVTLTGNVASGLFAGNAAVQVVIGPTLDTLDCLFPPGITSRIAAITLTIL